MSSSNVVAQQVESHGVCTFSAKEMAFNILGLMHPLLFSMTQVEPIWADLNGGMDRLPDLADITTKSRMEINAESTLRKAVSRDNALEYKITNGPNTEAVLKSVPVTPRADFRFEFPTPELPEMLVDLPYLQDLVNLEQVIVIWLR
jgi:fatty acid synthase subunit alpha